MTPETTYRYDTRFDEIYSFIKADDSSIFDKFKRVDDESGNIIAVYMKDDVMIMEFHLYDFMVNAIHYNRMNVIRYLVSKKLVDINKRVVTSELSTLCPRLSLLSYTCQLNRLDILEYLLQNGGIPDAECIRYSMIHKHIDNLKLLLRFGANPKEEYTDALVPSHQQLATTWNFSNEWKELLGC